MRFVQIVSGLVVHWVGCVCSQFWHVRTCLRNSWHKLQVAAFAQLAAVGCGSNTCVYVIAICTMYESTEQRICIKYCFKIGKPATETYQLLQQAYDEGAMGRTQVFDWFRRFNILAPELFFLILAHSIYKMWITQEPNTLELWNKLHFEEKKRRVYTMFKIFGTYICWINI